MFFVSSITTHRLYLNTVAYDSHIKFKLYLRSNHKEQIIFQVDVDVALNRNTVHRLTVRCTVERVEACILKQTGHMMLL